MTGVEKFNRTDREEKGGHGEEMFNRNDRDELRRTDVMK
jgi:hypothetical protein